MTLSIYKFIAVEVCFMSSFDCMKDNSIEPIAFRIDLSVCQ